MEYVRMQFGYAWNSTLDSVIITLPKDVYEDYHF